MAQKILIVDDNKFNIKLLEQILQDENYEVHKLYSGTDVLEISKSINPDAILLDVMMPGIDGFEVCELLKEVPETKDIPVIMVTAKTDGEDLKKAFRLGAFDYIKKPLDELEVVARLSSALMYREHQKKLETLAMKDGLTGLYNHRLILELFEKEYNKAQRNNESIAFIMLDIDYFKNVNDTYGHRMGDVVIRKVADILEENTRSSDIIGRYGGEEFCIILPDIACEEVVLVCERIRKAIEKSEFKINDDTINVTISIGICFKYPTQDSSSEDMLIQADKTLYRAKNGGRNRIETHIINMG